PPRRPSRAALCVRPGFDRWFAIGGQGGVPGFVLVTLRTAWRRSGLRGRDRRDGVHLAVHVGCARKTRAARRRTTGRARVREIVTTTQRPLMRRSERSTVADRRGGEQQRQERPHGDHAYPPARPHSSGGGPGSLAPGDLRCESAVA